MNFGNSIEYTNEMKFIDYTAEYLPPEILQHLIDIETHPENKPNLSSNLFANITESSTDLWSLAIIIIEIITGIPVWIPLSS